MLCNFLRILKSWANFQNLKEINEIKNFKPSHRPNPACLGLGLAHGVWAGFFTKGTAKLGPWRHWGGSPAVPALPAARQPTDDADRWCGESILQINRLRRSPKSVGGGRALGGGGGDGVGRSGGGVAVTCAVRSSSVEGRPKGRKRGRRSRARRQPFTKGNRGGRGGGALHLIGARAGEAWGWDRLPGVSGTAVGNARWRETPVARSRGKWGADEWA
jgi:hypothetical protein